MRKFTLVFTSYNLHDKSDNGTKTSSSYNDLKTVLDTIPDLTNEEIECIVSLQVGESLTLDNSKIIRTV